MHSADFGVSLDPHWPGHWLTNCTATTLPFYGCRLVTWGMTNILFRAYMGQVLATWSPWEAGCWVIDQDTKFMEVTHSMLELGTHLHQSLEWEAADLGFFTLQTCQSPKWIYFLLSCRWLTTTVWRRARLADWLAGWLPQIQVLQHIYMQFHYR